MDIVGFFIMGILILVDTAIHVGIQLYFEGHPLFKD